MGGLLSGVGRLLFGKTASNGGQDASQAAQPYLQNIPQYGREAYNPYIQQGQQAGGIAQGEYNKLVQDPSAFINAIMGKYQESPGYQYQQQQGSRALSNTAAAGGYRGGQFEQQQQAELLNSLLGSDMQQWLQNNLNVYGTGLQGQQHNADTGFEASSRLGDYLGGAAGQQGAYAFEGQRSRNANRNSFLNNLLGAGATGVGAYFGGKTGGSAGGYKPLSGGAQGYGAAQQQKLNNTLYPGGY